MSNKFEMIVKAGLWFLLVSQLTVTVDAVTANPVRDAKLLNATQSSTDCSGRCRYASRAIDDNWNSASGTTYTAGISWWQAYLNNTMVVQQIQVAAEKGPITTTLYKGDKLAGHCQNHTAWSVNRVMLNCYNITADRVRLEMSTASQPGKIGYLGIWGIRVIGVNSGTTITSSVLMITAFLAWLAL